MLYLLLISCILLYCTKNACIKEKGHVVFCHESMTTASQKCNNISQICNKSLVIVENTTDKISSTNRNRIKA